MRTFLPASQPPEGFSMTVCSYEMGSAVWWVPGKQNVVLECEQKSSVGISDAKSALERGNRVLSSTGGSPCSPGKLQRRSQQDVWLCRSQRWKRLFSFFVRLAPAITSVFALALRLMLPREQDTTDRKELGRPGRAGLCPAGRNTSFCSQARVIVQREVGFPIRWVCLQPPALKMGRWRMDGARTWNPVSRGSLLPLPPICNVTLRLSVSSH